jgi:AAA+ superfamily predicted ATPase
MNPLLPVNRNDRTDKSDQHFISRALGESPAALSYRVGQQIASMWPDRYVLKTDDREFDVRAYAHAELCELAAKPGVFQNIGTRWESDEKQTKLRVDDGWYDVRWKDHSFELITMTIPGAFFPIRASWLIAPDRETAESFFSTVLIWNYETHGEMLVFDDDMWQKDTKLYQAIKNATLDNLILTPGLKEELKQDLDTFFASKDLYARYGVPWRRGLLLLGPPGNGKTHAVKGLINALGKPCLYVRNISGDKPTVSIGNIRRVFERARATAPCILVLEDLDSMVNSENRSAFLNELDGFIDNSGIVTIATTNHPEKLDSAIVDRPSRFDRKYHFDLPGVDERRAYIQRWNVGMQAELQMTGAGITDAANASEGFSFAYLKELMMSAITAWMAAAQPGSMDTLIAEQISHLRAQMVSAANAERAEKDAQPKDTPEPQAAA